MSCKYHIKYQHITKRTKYLRTRYKVCYKLHNYQHPPLLPLLIQFFFVLLVPRYLPICSDYCDRWYQACAADMACAANWITDWNYTDNGNNHCKAEAKCARFNQVHRLRLILHFSRPVALYNECI